RLIVGGCMPGNRNSLRPLSWYDLIEKGLATSGLQMQNVPPPDGVVKRYLRAEDASPEPGITAAPAAHFAPLELPAWLRAPAPRGAVPEDVLRPSDPALEDGRAIRPGESGPQRARALQRGLLVHRLLQSLPDLPAGRRQDVAALYLARNAEDWNEDDRAALAGRVLALLDDARFAAVFAAGSRAEVSIAGRLARPGRPPALVSGQIDRLVVADEVLIIDYKTNHAPPRSVAGAPPAYLRQLALYRAVLAKLYPQKPLRAALLWTETPELMEIPPPALDAQLASALDGSRPA
ncbi:MAG TPA: PD-(D/E)XK nuclease family protein, partial [Bradyrhizobium sp.]|nr:PD-(D/E)XK nuclease family protein [Bradyrhizobium sp.]